MSSPPELSATSSHKTEIQLNVISPSTQVQKLTFSGLSTSCTIYELKEKICDATPMKVAPNRQRLIYRGHVLTQEQRTLKDIFGQETIDSTDEPLTIHLILPPTSAPQHGPSNSTPSASAPRTSTPQPTRTTSTIANPQPTPQGPGTAPAATFLAGGTTQPQINPVLHPGQAHATQGQLPPQLQQTFDQFNAINQQLANQIASFGTQQGIPHTPHVHPGPAMQAHFQIPHGFPQMQQFHGQFPIPVNPPGRPHIHQQNLHQRPQTPHNQPRGVPGHPSPSSNHDRPSSAPPPGLTNTNTVVREHRGPNGERWQTVTQTSTLQVDHTSLGAQGNSSALHPPHTSMPRSISSPGTAANMTRTTQANLSISGATPSPPMLPFQTTLTPNPQPQSIGIILQSLQNQLSSLEAILTGGSIPPDSAFETASHYLRSIGAHIPPDQYQTLFLRHAGLLNRATQLRANIDAQLRRYADSATSGQQSTSDTESTQVYLLSSPSGPHALLLSPHGNYATPWPAAPIFGLQAGIGTSSAFGLQPTLPASVQAATSTHQPQTNPAQNAQVQAQVVPHQQNNVAGMPPVHHLQQAQPAQHANHARDIVRIIIPLGGHLWLLIRLFGFVYFFTHGASWRRTILLSLGALFLFLAQTGAFRPLRQHVWDPVRRHVEALLPLAGDEQPRRRNSQHENTANAAGSSTETPQPSPEEAAERLLRDRARHDGNFVRQALRRVERAVALFIASLVPGVGERHIAAREAAEAARQAEEREREERARREEEERQQQANSGNSANAEGDSNVQVSNEIANNGSAAPENAAQPPLIEV